MDCSPVRLQLLSWRVSTYYAWLYCPATNHKRGAECEPRPKWGASRRGQCLQGQIIGPIAGATPRMPFYKIHFPSVLQHICRHQNLFEFLISMEQETEEEPISVFQGPSQEDSFRLTTCKRILLRHFRNGKYSCVSSSNQGNWKAHV